MLISEALTGNFATERNQPAGAGQAEAEFTEASCTRARVRRHSPARGAAAEVCGVN